MPPTKQEYLDLLKQQESYGAPYKPSLDMALGMIRTAAVSFEQLTNDPNWDRFLSILQGMYEDAKKERDRYKDLCTTLFFDASLREAQCHYHRQQAQVDLLEKIMLLPTQLKEQYDMLRKE